MEERKSITKNILDENIKEIEDDFIDDYYLKKIPVIVK